MDNLTSCSAWLGKDGLLWAEYDTTKPLEEIVKDICRVHEQRLGYPPNQIMVHSSLIPMEIKCIGIRLIPQRETLPYHYFAVRVPSSQGADCRSVETTRPVDMADPPAR